MIYNYHTHTFRCHHAVGTPEEYIKRAIEAGIKYMGFSDHAPFSFPDGHESGFRIPIVQAKEYVEELSLLREKYKDLIDIKIGFEMEYYPTYFNEMLKVAQDAGGEYLILGQHFLYDEYPNGVVSGSPTENKAYLDEYVSCVVSAIKSGSFTYIAHPDMFNFIGELDVYREAVRRICSTSREFDVPLEINFLGIRDHRNYPNENFWKVVGEEKSPVTFGFDAHDVPSAFDDESLKKAESIVKKFSLNYIGIPVVKTITPKTSFDRINID